jgi:hypothetical protein
VAGNRVGQTIMMQLCKYINLDNRKYVTLFKNISWWPVIPALVRPQQEDCKFKASLSYIARFCKNKNVYMKEIKCYFYMAGRVPMRT